METLTEDEKAENGRKKTVIRSTKSKAGEGKNNKEERNAKQCKIRSKGKENKNNCRVCRE